jgi:hypothetical protein
MKEEQKELLLVELSARLPYGVKVEYENKIFDIDYISSYQEIKLDEYTINYTIDISEVKPYLFPLESMTEEQKEEFDRLYTYDALIVEPQWKLIDFCNKHHLDYRGFIPMGLAIDATHLNVY